MAVLEGHHQPISVIKVSNDSNYLVAGAEDGYILCWNLPQVISGGGSTDSCEENVAQNTWSHQQKVTDIQIGMGGADARCYSSSLDKSVRVCDA